MSASSTPTWSVAVVATPRPNVQHALASGEVGEADQFFGGAASARVDDALTEHGEERVQVGPRHIGAGGVIGGRSASQHSSQTGQ